MKQSRLKQASKLVWPLAAAGVFGLYLTATAAPIEAQIRLPQGWTEDDIQQVYHVYHGSQVMPLRWFEELELGQSTKKFKENLSAYGVIPDPMGDLPAGVAAAEDPETAHLYGESKWVGFNCVACHTSALAVGGKTVVIEGGPSQFNIQKFETDLIEGVRATLADSEKFKRFAQGLKATDPNRLKDYLEKFAQEFSGWFQRNHRYFNKDKVEVSYGPGRMDGLGGAANDLICHLTDRIGDPELSQLIGNDANCRTSQPPSSIPFLWGMTQVEFTMWDGTVHSSLGRNYGASTAAYGKNWIEKTATGEFLYRTTTNIETLYKIERLYDKLRAPKWEDLVKAGVAPAVDPQVLEERLKRGEVLYRQNCASCHAEQPANSTPNMFGNAYWQVSVVPQKEIATDPEYLDAILGREARLPEFLVGPFKSRFGDNSVGEDNRVPGPVYRAFVIGAMITGDFKAQKIAPLDQAKYTNCRNNSLRQPVQGYRARSLEGIGFTAPYLHNGSVPTLYDLLLPADDRPKSFFVGCKEYDLAKLGFACDRLSENAELFDTTVSGNFNTGHEYGTELSDEDRFALIEYMKRIDNPEPARPKNAACN